MSDMAEGFVVATDGVVCDLVREARRRLVVVAPALTPGMATAILSRLGVLDEDAVTIVLDSDPEVYRLGYGTLAACETVTKAAQAAGIAIRQQPGVRIGLVISDARTLIFTPVPALVEAGPNTYGQANAIRLTAPPKAVESDLGLGEGPGSLGTRLMAPVDIERVRRDLAANPPQRFDLARMVRAFNAYIEFVELEVRGTDVARHLVTIPQHLMAVVPARTRRNLRTSCRLTGDDSLSGQKIAQERRLHTRRFLKVIPGYGVAIRRRDREEFDRAVTRLAASVRAFAQKVQASLHEQIERSIMELQRSLLSSLVRRPPDAWIPMTGEVPDRETVKSLLDLELREAFGTAAQLAGQMSVTCRYKGVTYELLTDPVFIERARAAFPDLPRLHDERIAAVASESQPFPLLDTPPGD